MRLFLLLSFLTLFISSTSRAEQRFFSSLYDVPIMGALEEVPEMALSYDKGAGRIARASALYMQKDVEAVFRFYSQSLPQFGWKKLNNNKYLRDGEQLLITGEWLDDAWLITFALAPQ